MNEVSVFLPCWWRRRSSRKGKQRSGWLSGWPDPFTCCYFLTSLTHTTLVLFQHYHTLTTGLYGTRTTHPTHHHRSSTRGQLHATERWRGGVVIRVRVISIQHSCHHTHTLSYLLLDVLCCPLVSSSGTSTCLCVPFYGFLIFLNPLEIRINGACAAERSSIRHENFGLKLVQTG